MSRDSRRRLQPPKVAFGVSVVLAAALAATLYFTITSLPYLALSPTGDPTFGELNECLLSLVPNGRVGFAVSGDAARAATFTADAVAECRRLPQLTARKWELGGATRAAWDGQGRLWVARRAGDDAGSRQLLLLEGSAPQVMGEVSPQLLAGTPSGVVALEPTGRLVAVAADGQVLALRDLQPVRDAHLSLSADGSLIALVTSGGYHLFDTSLRVIRSEAPCEVEYLWWLREPGRAVVRCGPTGQWALELEVHSGELTAARRVPQTQSVLVGPNGPWVQGCDGLPCTAMPP